LADALSLIAATPLFFELVGPTAHGPKPPADRHHLKHQAAIESFSRSQPFVFNRILP
jgi:hypothetical protein